MVGEVYKNENERENCFENHRVHAGEISKGRKIRSSERDGPPDGFWNDCEQQERGSQRTEKSVRSSREAFETCRGAA